MSHADAFRAVMEAVAERDLERLIELTDPGVEWQSFFAIAGEYHGHEGLREYVRDLEETWETIDVQVDEVLTAGSIAVGVGRIHYRGRGSGVETEATAGWVFKFRDGRVVLFRAFSDPEQVLEAVGA